MKLPSFFLALATFATLTLGTSHPLYGGNPEIFLIGDTSQGAGIVGAYTLAGGTLNATLVSGLGFPVGAVVSGNDLFVLDNSNGTVGEYNATTGATINASLISGLADAKGIAISGSMLFLTVNNDMAFTAQVAEYTTGGVLVNGALITGLRLAVGIAVSGSDLYVADFSSGTVGQYTTSGTTINPSLITPSGRAYNLAVSGTSLFVISPEAETVYNYTTSGDFVTSWQVTNSSYPTGLAVSGSDVFVTDFGSKTVREYTTTGAIVNNALISGVSALVGMTISAAGAPTPTPTPTPPPPPHGGLSATTFTVDESTSPTSNVADTVLRFAAVQTGTPAGLSVRVQYSINGSTWTDLPDGDAGNMIYDPAIGKFITATANYLAANGTSFRAIASAKGYTDRISNVVGSFSLASSKPRLSPPIISITGNGTFADLYFRSYVAKPSGGMALRVQSSTTPVSQASWTDLSDGVLGHMKPTTDPTRYYLMDDKLPAATGVYFRVIGSLTGYVDALSTPIGPFTLISDTPPSVKVTAPHASSGSGTAASPFVYNFGPLGFVATATASGGGKVQGIGLTADGSLFGLSLTSSVTGTYTPTTIGDHTIEAIASDKLGGTSRFGTSPIYIRVIPSAKSQEKAESQVGSDFKSDATTSGTVYTQVQDSGQWTDPSTWKSSLGTAGVPGPNDLAIISGTVFLSKAVTVRSVSLVTGLNGANFAGSIVGGTKFKNAVDDLSVTGAITDHGAAVGTFPLDTIHLILASGATCDFWNTAHPITVAGCIIDNYGTFSVHGGLGVVGLTAFNNYGSTNFLPPLALPSSAGVDPTIDTRTLAADAVNTSGLINSALTSQLVGHDGASIMTLDGGSLISQDGGSLISQDGSTLSVTMVLRWSVTMGVPSCRRRVERLFPTTVAASPIKGRTAAVTPVPVLRTIPRHPDLCRPVAKPISTASVLSTT